MSIATKIKLLLGTADVYKSLFKGGFVLVASAVIALGQIGPELYSKDLEAHKLKFEAEYAMKASIDNKTDCTKAGTNEVACRLATHHLKTLDATLRLWETFTELTFYVGALLLGLGFIGFVIPLSGSSVTKRTEI